MRLPPLGCPNFFTALNAKLETYNVLKQIWAINEDVFGAYFFNRPEIKIYWLAIGITAMMTNTSVEAFTFVVLTHELAHAYTHLGRNIDGHQWELQQFADTDDCIVEGLAQFYTRAVCKKLAARYPLPLTVFEAILAVQSPAYTCFQSWTIDKDDPGEFIRAAMLRVRREGITEIRHFAAILNSKG